MTFAQLAQEIASRERQRERRTEVIACGAVTDLAIFLECHFALIQTGAALQNIICFCMFALKLIHASKLDQSIRIIEAGDVFPTSTGDSRELRVFVQRYIPLHQQTSQIHVI